MIVVGLTGGIGSGKTTVAEEFKKLGIPIYIADKEAKKLMKTSIAIKKKLIELFGEDAYIDGELNKNFIADIIFNDEYYLKKMNDIIHPAVGEHFKSWMEKKESPYVIKEAAVLFENGGNHNCDFVITVTAPKKIRIDRLLKRDKTTLEKIEAIMKNQWDDERKIVFSDFVVENKDIKNLKYQVIDVHHKILNKIKGLERF